VTWWGPYYALFIWEDPQVTANVLTTVTSSLYDAPFYSGMIVLYVGLHMLGCIYAGLTGNEILPFSSFHMFSEPKNLWSKNSNIALWLTDKPHATGYLKHYCFPFCRKQHVNVSELGRLPFKYLLITRKADGTRRAIGNVVLSDKFQALLYRLYNELERGSSSFADAKAIEEMLELQDALKQQFAAASRSEGVTSLQQCNPIAG